MTFTFNPFSGNLDYYERLYDLVTHNIDTVIGLGDLKKIHVMDVTGGDRTFTLPEITTGMLGKWVILMRDGTANDLIIQAGGMDLILNSSAGGYITTVDATGTTDTHDFTWLNCMAVKLTQWTCDGFGIWSTY